MEERGENGRKHAVKKRWTRHTENPRRGCIGKCNETAGKHDNHQRKSNKIPWKMEESGANAENTPCKILWKMEETGANARNKP